MDTGTRSGSCTSTGMEASILALAVILALALCQEVRVRNYEYINLFLISFWLRHGSVAQIVEQ